jgi:hypothetical protein
MFFWLNISANVFFAWAETLAGKRVGRIWQKKFAKPLDKFWKFGEDSTRVLAEPFVNR